MGKKKKQSIEDEAIEYAVGMLEAQGHDYGACSSVLRGHLRLKQDPEFFSLVFNEIERLRKQDKIRDMSTRVSVAANAQLAEHGSVVLTLDSGGSVVIGERGIG